MWTVDVQYIQQWLDRQDDETVAAVFGAIKVLAARGPALGRPLVDTVAGSRLRNMKELRPASPGNTELRILFAFDPRRQAVMLLAGDKAHAGRSRNAWSGWYRRAIPAAERIYLQHLAELGGLE